MVLRIELDMYIMFAIYIGLYRFRLFNAIRHDLPSVEMEPPPKLLLFPSQQTFVYIFSICK